MLLLQTHSSCWSDTYVTMTIWRGHTFTQRHTTKDFGERARYRWLWFCTLLYVSVDGAGRSVLASVPAMSFYTHLHRDGNLAHTKKRRLRTSWMLREFAVRMSRVSSWVLCFIGCGGMSVSRDCRYSTHMLEVREMWNVSVVNLGPAYFCEFTGIAYRSIFYNMYYIESTFCLITCSFLGVLKAY